MTESGCKGVVEVSTRVHHGKGGKGGQGDGCKKRRDWWLGEDSMTTARYPRRRGATLTMTALSRAHSRLHRSGSGSGAVIDYALSTPSPLRSPFCSHPCLPLFADCSLVALSSVTHLIEQEAVQKRRTVYGRDASEEEEKTKEKKRGEGATEPETKPSEC